jgi:hypothetical protein
VFRRSLIQPDDRGDRETCLELVAKLSLLHAGGASVCAKLIGPLQLKIQTF